MEQVTMAQIAKKLHVDQSTVSLALRNSERISEATRNRVHKTALEMGYKTNPFVAALMKMRRSRSKEITLQVVAWVTQWEKENGWMQIPSFQSFYKGAKECLLENGFLLEHFWNDQKSFSSSRFSGILWNRGITGIIVAPVPDGMSVNLDWDKFSAVTVGSSVHSPKLDRVESSHFDTVTTAIQQCHTLGYRRIGLAINELSLARFNQRFLAAYLVKQGSDKPLVIFSKSVKTKAEIKAFHAWFRHERPEVIITLSKLDGETYRDLLKGMNLKVPEDVGIVILSCHTIKDLYTGIYQYPEMIGAQAANQSCSAWGVL